MTNGYNFDALNNTLTISTSFAKKASKVGSPDLKKNHILCIGKYCFSEKGFGKYLIS